MPETNVEMATRDGFRRTVTNEILLALPLVSMLVEHRRVKFTGKALTGVVYKASLKSVAQSYAPREPLTSGSVTILGKPSWGWKYMQTPVEYGVEEEVQNDGGRETAPVDVVKALIEAGHDGTRRKFCEMFYSTASGSTSESGKAFQSLIAALDHDATYGGISRATTVTNQWWQGASPGTVFTDQDTAVSPSIPNFRTWKAAARRHTKPGSSLYCFLPEGLFQEFQASIDVHNLVAQKGRLAKYGHEAIEIDGVEFVQDSWLTENGRTTDVFLLNPLTWELRMSPKRNLRMTQFQWLGAQDNAPDKYLARVLAAGNMVCWQPGANLWLSNVA